MDPSVRYVGWKWLLQVFDVSVGWRKTGLVSATFSPSSYHPRSYLRFENAKPAAKPPAPKLYFSSQKIETIPRQRRDQERDSAAKSSGQEWTVKVPTGALSHCFFVPHANIVLMRTDLYSRGMVSSGMVPLKDGEQFEDGAEKAQRSWCDEQRVLEAPG